MEQTEKKEPFYNQIEKYIIVCMFLVMTVIIALNVVTRFVSTLPFLGASNWPGCCWYGHPLPESAGQERSMPI